MLNAFAFPLPIDEVLATLLARLAEQGGAVLEAPPGAGKSTRVPLALLEAPWRDGGRILVLEPRRVAARAVAGFMADQLGEPVGATVGYRTRHDTRVSGGTVIEVVTEGILTRLLLDDPSLEGYAAVLFDEFHERSLQADLGLALVQEVRGALREDLRLLVMSATLDGERLAAGLRLPVVRSEGRSHPVEVRYSPAPGDRHWLDHCTAAVRRWAGEGTTLVFLPGVGEIERLRQRLGDLAIPVEALHGRLGADIQAAVLRAPDGARRVVLATNVAETSVTIEGVSTVIDSGLERRPRYDPRRHRDRLVTRRISQANADQRAGRAGRLRPGKAVRLWAREEVLARHIEPEMRQTGLQGLVLDLARWGCRDPTALFWLDAPPDGAWNAAVDRLRARGALDGEGGITDFGRRLGGLPLDPETAALVLRGRERGLPETAARLAVLLDERAPGLDRELDLAERLKRFAARPGDYPLLQRSATRLLRAGERDQPEVDPGLLLAEVFAERVARRRGGDQARYLLAGGSGATLPPQHPLSRSPWLVILDTDGRAQDAGVRLAWALNEHAVTSLLETLATWQERVVWDDRAGRVEARRVRALGAIEVDSRPLPDPSPELVQQGLLAGIRSNGLSVLPWNEHRHQWRARAACLHALEPDQWPDFSADALLADLEHWLAPFLAGRRRLRDLDGLPLGEALLLRLGPQRRGELDRLLPPSIRVASGRNVTLNYRAEGGPRLAVKLQECFGMVDLPALVGGRLPITLELLTPAGRPAAITGNLARFWREGYPAVRKDLRGRYPKHPWPEDPTTATATALTKKRQAASGRTSSGD